MHNYALFPILLSASTLLSYSALAACTASPDCATLGYDKTSCPSGDDVLKCPFDATKMKCIPLTCETIGKRTCGDMCVTESFTGCCKDADCTDGQMCKNNICEDLCGKSPYSVGDVYCNAGGTPIGVVGKISNGGKNGIVVEKNHSSCTIPWGCYRSDLSCITNMPGTDGGSNPELRADYNGKSNTACIVQNSCNYNGTTGAGVYCDSRSVEGVTGWYLPADGELYDTMIGNRTTVNTGLSKISGSTAIPSAGTSILYWSSSEPYDDAAGIWDFYFDYRYFDAKNNGNCVRCVLAF